MSLEKMDDLFGMTQLLDKTADVESQRGASGSGHGNVHAEEKEIEIVKDGERKREMDSKRMTVDKVDKIEVEENEFAKDDAEGITRTEEKEAEKEAKQKGHTKNISVSDQVGFYS